MKDLTQGSILKTILGFTVPLIAGNIFQLLYSFTDSLIVGNMLGVNELAGVGATGSLNFLIVGFATGMTSGFSILIARHFGAKDEEQMKKSIAHSLVLGTIAAVLLSLISCLLLRPILTWMHTPADVFEHSYSYIRLIFGGMVITMLYNTASSVLRSVGDSRTPLYFLIIASIVNIALDILLMGVFHTGVAGAAIATLISQAISVILCLIFILRKYRFIIPSRQHYRPDSALIKELLAQGFSLGFQSSFIAVGSILVQSALNSLGTIYVAANTAAHKISQIFMQPLITFGTAMTTFASQNLGAGKLDRVKKGLRTTSAISIVWSVFSFLCSMIAGPALIGLLVNSSFDGAAMVAEQGSLFLRLNLLFFPFLGLLFIYRNTLQGIGNKTTPLASGVLELIVKIVTALWLAPAFGYMGIIFCEPIAWVLCMILLLAAFYRDPRVKALRVKGN